jgi:hypothetical protein
MAPVCAHHVYIDAGKDGGAGGARPHAPEDRKHSHRVRRRDDGPEEAGVEEGDAVREAHEAEEPHDECDARGGDGGADEREHRDRAHVVKEPANECKQDRRAVSLVGRIDNSICKQEYCDRTASSAGW